MNIKRKIVALIGAVFIIIAIPFAASGVSGSAAPAPIRAAAAAVALPEASAASDCTLSTIFKGWTGGCRWGKTALQVKCVDGNRVYYKTSGIAETRNHVVRCHIMYRAESVRILHY